jgi:hypothetical protein
VGWKGTAVLGAAAAVAALAYFLSGAPPGGTSAPDDRRLLAGFRAEAVKSIEILRKDGPRILLQREQDVSGEYWRLKEPVDHPADGAAVQQMLFAIDRFTTSPAFERGSAEAAPAITGLDDPRVKVLFRQEGRESVISLGSSPPQNTRARFVARAGDPKVYLADADTCDQFLKPAWQYRTRALLRYPAHAVVKVVLEHKFLKKAAKDRPAEVEVERSVFERVEQGTERGWWLVEPHRERVDEHRMQYLVRVLAELEASEYQPAGDLKSKGLDRPQVRYALHLHGIAAPVELAFGDVLDGGRRRWVHVPSTGEAARLEEPAFEKLPSQRKHMRADALFPMGPDELKLLDVDAGPLGRIRVERREAKKEGEAVASASWALLEPVGRRVEKERLDAFVSNLMVQKIQDFLGAQDFKLARLDPADVVVTASAADGRVQKIYFGLGADGFARKEGVAEVFTVKPELVRMLQRLELNFLDAEVFNVPRDALREFSFESREPGRLEPLFYRLRLDPAAKAWRFADPKHEGAKPDVGRLGDLLAMLNYVRAESYIGKDAATAAKHRLDPLKAPARLAVKWEGGPPAGVEILFSEDLSDKPTRPVYYARRADEAAIFQVSPLLVESLKRFPREPR